ncbi:phage tail protein [Vibrio fluvialis]|nr:phage tail protein [Vibrio fluvialis]
MADENTDLRCYLTNAGIAAENNSIQLNRSLNVTEMVFGSGFLADEKDPREQTAMIKEEYAVPCALLFDEDTPTLLVFKGDLPTDVGGFYINEVGIRLEDGTIYGYARGKGDYKPTLEQGATDSVRYAVEMYSSNADNVAAKIDLSTVYADWEDLEATKKKAEDDLAAHADAPDPHPQYPTAAISQFLPYDATRLYSVGEVCYTKDVNGKVSYWEWYSNVESLAGKEPSDASNRQAGWIDDTKPFYWTPYKKARSGTPLWPWMSMTFPEGTLNVLGNSVPTAVFWRLAEAFPEFVNGANIDFPETGGEFFRVLDQGRGIDTDRLFNSSELDQLQGHEHKYGDPRVNYAAAGNLNAMGVNSEGTHTTEEIVSDGINGTPRVGSETRPRNLAFPILVEI